MIFMTTLSKLSFQEKGHGLCKKKTCSRKHDEKKSWTHEGPIIQKRERVGHMKFHVFKKERER